MRDYVYLAGAIYGKSDSECGDWRKDAAAILQMLGILTKNPMDRDYRGEERYRQHEIVEGDKAAIDECWGMIVNAESPSWGTAMEVLYARQKGLVIIAFSSSMNVSPWLEYHADHVVRSLLKAIRLASVCSIAEKAK